MDDHRDLSGRILDRGFRDLLALLLRKEDSFPRGAAAEKTVNPLLNQEL